MLDEFEEQEVDYTESEVGLLDEYNETLSLREDTFLRNADDLAFVSSYANPYVQGIQSELVYD